MAKPASQRLSNDEHMALMVKALQGKLARESPPQPHQINDMERVVVSSISRLRATRGREDAGAEAREALADWANAMWGYLDLVLPPSAIELYRGPFHFLRTVLWDLEQGTVDPALKPAKVKNGRPRQGARAVIFKVTCVVAADEAYRAGRPSKKTRRQADLEIRERVKKVAPAYGLSVRPGTIDGWRRDIEKARPRESLRWHYEEWQRQLPLLRDRPEVDDVIELILARVTDPERFD
jgi:hypothetical protein